MPPKRKATATAEDSEPPQTQPRRRTRSTAANAVDVLVELPPAKRTRRHTTTKADEEHAPPEKHAEGLEESKRVLRGTRAAARGRKVESTATEKLNQPDPGASKRRGRGKKVEPEEDVEEPQSEGPAAPRPLSPIQEKPAQIVPKKRGRQVAKAKIITTKTELEPEPEPEASEVVETSRPKRTRRTKANNDAPPPLSSSAAKPQLKEEVEEPQAEPAASRPPSPTGEKPEQSMPKKRGRAAKAKPAMKPELEVSEIAESSRPKRARRTKDAIDALEDEKTVRTASSSKLITESKAPAATNAPKTRSRRKAGPAEPPKPSSPKPALRASKFPSPSDSDESSSEDELLLTSKNRPTTPTRIGGRIGTPRTVLHSVEITTPRHLRNTLRRDLGSPTPRASARIPPVGTPRLPAVFPTASGSPIKRLPTKQRITRTPPRPILADASEPGSPSRTPRRGAETFPANGRRIQPASSSDDLPRILPDHLRPLLDHQKRAILKSLQHPPEIDEIELYGEDYPPTNSAAYEQLTDLLTGSVVRGEGNSCLLIGPSGSGKTQMVERAIATMPSNPIVVRLSGYAQHNDRLAIREIAWQLAQQTGTSFLPSDADEDEDGEPTNPTEAAEAVTKEHEKEQDEDTEGEADEDENPFVDHPSAPAPRAAESVIALPPPAHLLALISMIPTLPRPTIIVLDGFDLFAGHARQALLYCLLDTAQSCRAGMVSGTGSGMAVVGVTARVDTINLLEKRVKSRFSGRMIRTACPAKLGHWVELAKGVLGAPVGDEMEDEDVVRTESGREWEKMWKVAVEKFAEDEEVVEMLRETYALARDFQIFRRIMTGLALELTPASPFPTRARLESSVSRQRCPPRYPSLNTLPYPAVCLLIASVHAQTSGHDVFTFEMLYDSFKTQLRASQSAPVHVEGGGIGMVRCSREVLFSAFERLVDLHIFLAAAAPSANIAKEFALHRSTVDRFTVRKAVDAIGQLNLKKWLTKA